MKVSLSRASIRWLMWLTFLGCNTYEHSSSGSGQAVPTLNQRTVNDSDNLPSGLTSGNKDVNVVTEACLESTQHCPSLPCVKSKSSTSRCVAEASGSPLIKEAIVNLDKSIGVLSDFIKVFQSQSYTAVQVKLLKELCERIQNSSSEPTTESLEQQDQQDEEPDWDFIKAFMEYVDSREPVEEIKTFLYARVGQTHKRHLLESTYRWNEREYTPLHYAAEEGYLEVVDHLIQDYDLPADILTESKKVTPLQCAAVRGHTNVVDYLIGRKANVNYQNSDGLSVLHYAISGRSYGIVNTLIDKGANIDIEGDEDNFNLLHAAAEANIPDLVELVMTKAREQGTDVLERMLSQHTKEHEATPLDFAKYVGATCTYPILLKASEQLGITTSVATSTLATDIEDQDIKAKTLSQKQQMKTVREVPRASEKTEASNPFKRQKNS